MAVTQLSFASHTMGPGHGLGRGGGGGSAGWLRTPLNADCGLLTLMFQWLKQVTGLSHREERGGQHNGGHLSGAPRRSSPPGICVHWPPTSTGHLIPDRDRSVPASVPCPQNSCRVWRCSGHPVGTPQGGELRPHVPTITWHTSSGQQPDLNLRRDHGHTETPT